MWIAPSARSMPTTDAPLKTDALTLPSALRPAWWTMGEIIWDTFKRPLPTMLRWRLRHLIDHYAGSMWRDAAHERRFRQMQAIMGTRKKRDTPQFFAALYLLTANDDITRRPITVSATKALSWTISGCMASPEKLCAGASRKNTLLRHRPFCRRGSAGLRDDRHRDFPARSKRRPHRPVWDGRGRDSLSAGGLLTKPCPEHGQFHAVSLSGGKDSSAMLLLMIERGMPIDLVLHADTGMEFPEMYEHLQKLDEHLYQERGLHITTLRHPKGFEWLMFDEPKQKKSSIENRQRLGIPCFGKRLAGYRGCAGVPASSKLILWIRRSTGSNGRKTRSTTSASHQMKRTLQGGCKQTVPPCRMGRHGVGSPANLL